MPDLSEVRGQAEARRGLEIALAGGHGLLLIGPPGSGKTLLARTIPGCCRRSTTRAALAATVVASAAGEGPIRELRRRPPFRAPHHTLSYAAMVGGGPRLSPGEVTLADQGVLFLDELPEFDRDVLEALRQPLEDGRVAIVAGRPGDDVPGPLPARRGDEPVPVRLRRVVGPRVRAARRSCPERYQRRVSGPLRDRIDLWVSMPRVAPSLLVRGAEPEGSAVVAARIAAARRIALGARPASSTARLTGRLAARRVPARARPRERRVVQLAETRAGQRSRHGADPAGRADDRRPRRCRRPSPTSISTRPPGIGRPTCGSRPSRRADVLGVGTPGRSGRT